MQQPQQQQQLQRNLSTPVGLQPGVLRFFLWRGCGLKNTDWFKPMDPYCIISWQDFRFKTKVLKRGGANPVWNQEYALDIGSCDESVQIEIWDEDRIGRDDLVGMATMDLNKAREYRGGVMSLNVFRKGKQHGTLDLKLFFMPYDHTPLNTAASSLGPFGHPYIMTNSSAADVRQQQDQGNPYSSTQHGLDNTRSLQLLLQQQQQQVSNSGALGADNTATLGLWLSPPPMTPPAQGSCTPDMQQSPPQQQHQGYMANPASPSQYPVIRPLHTQGLPADCPQHSPPHMFDSSRSRSFRHGGMCMQQSTPGGYNQQAAELHTEVVSAARALGGGAEIQGCQVGRLDGSLPLVDPAVLELLQVTAGLREDLQLQLRELGEHEGTGAGSSAGALTDHQRTVLVQQSQRRLTFGIAEFLKLEKLLAALPFEAASDLHASVLCRLIQVSEVMQQAPDAETPASLVDQLRSAANNAAADGQLLTPRGWGRVMNEYDALLSQWATSAVPVPLQQLLGQQGPQAGQLYEEPAPHGPGSAQLGYCSSLGGPLNAFLNTQFNGHDLQQMMEALTQAAVDFKQQRTRPEQQQQHHHHQQQHQQSQGMAGVKAATALQPAISSLSHEKFVGETGQPVYLSAAQNSGGNSNTQQVEPSAPSAALLAPQQPAPAAADSQQQPAVLPSLTQKAAEHQQVMHKAGGSAVQQQELLKSRSLQQQQEQQQQQGATAAPAVQPPKDLQPGRSAERTAAPPAADNTPAPAAKQPAAPPPPPPPAAASRGAAAAAAAAAAAGVPAPPPPPAMGVLIKLPPRLKKNRVLLDVYRVITSTGDGSSNSSKGGVKSTLSAGGPAACGPEKVFEALSRDHRLLVQQVHEQRQQELLGWAREVQGFRPTSIKDLQGFVSGMDQKLKTLGEVELDVLKLMQDDWPVHRYDAMRGASMGCRRLQDLIDGINDWQRPAGATALDVRLALEKEFNKVQGVVQKFTNEELKLRLSCKQEGIPWFGPSLVTAVHDSSLKLACIYVSEVLQDVEALSQRKPPLANLQEQQLQAVTAAIGFLHRVQGFAGGLDDATNAAFEDLCKVMEQLQPGRFLTKAQRPVTAEPAGAASGPP